MNHLRSFVSTNFKKKSAPKSFTRFLESGKSAMAIRKGLIFMTPLVILSSLAQVVMYFPVEGYQSWLHGSAQPFYLILMRIYSATVDYFSLILSFAVAWCYAEQLKIKNGKSFVAFGATGSFILLIGVGSGQFDPAYFGPSGISSSMVAALVTTRLFHALSQHPVFQLKDEDSDSFLSKMAASIFPLGCIIGMFAVFSFALDTFFHMCLQDVIKNLLTVIFVQLQGNRLIMGIFYTVTLHLLWFFGIHGSHVYFEINEVFLNNLLHSNAAAVEAGQSAAEIVNTVSLNTFCNIGGAGATLALVIAILLAGRSANIRRVAKFAAFPSLFNVNEILLFGLPIVFNPTLLIPFLLTPLLNLCIGYGATVIGLVPVISRDINWTTPPLFSGYVATGSFAGVILQAVLIAVDILVYIPFVKKLDKKSILLSDLYEDDLEKIKTMEEKENENRRLILALSNMYDDVFEANVETRTIHIVRTSQAYGFSGEEELSFQAFQDQVADRVVEDEEGGMGNLLSSEIFQARLMEKGILEKEIKVESGGRRHWVRVQFVVMEARNGRPVLIMITVMDIDSLKKQQEEQNMALKSAYEAATQASAAKSAFLSNMSHDIRTPMNAILGMCTIARQHTEDKERVEDCLDKINASSIHLLNLINAVLDMSKIESGKVVLEERPFLLGQLLDEICAIIQPRMIQKKLDFRTNFDGVRGIAATGDPLRIRQIFVNILGNAVKFTPEGGRVSFEARRCASVYSEYASVEFVCSDTGSGMSEEFKSRLFQPFERDTRQEISSAEGNGLGMSITKNIIDMMNGEIYVDSSVGKGSAFTVILHLKESRETGTLRETEREEEAQTPKNLEGRRILLVEDNEMNREIAREFLSMTGVEIQEAVDGREAVEKVKASPAGWYDLILMDVQMPEMNGYEAAKAIRSLEREDAGLPIVAMTANAFADDVRMAREAGMNEHISKPIDVGRLLGVIQKILHERPDASESPQ